MDDFIIRNSKIGDLDAIVNIYNDMVSQRLATAYTETVKDEDKKKWYKEKNTKRFPIEVIEHKGKIIAWMNFQQINPLPIFDDVAEINLFISRNFRGRKMGFQLIEKSLNEAYKFNLKAIHAYVYELSKEGIYLFKKAGFKEWGRLPEIVTFDGAKHDLIILGKKV
ncbi:MAG: GNAT family N-acetyltransferase [Campylobacteraceae bacterium]